MKSYIFVSVLAIVIFWGFIGDVQADLSDGLVAYYPFNGNADDESGNGNDGVVNGASLTTDRFGNANSAYNFEGVDDYIDTSNLSSFLSDFTISFWVKSDESINGYFFQQGRENNPDDVWVGCFADENDPGKVNCVIDDGSTSYIVGNNGRSMYFDGKWHHLTFLRKDSNLYLYENNQLIDTQIAVGSNLNTTSLFAIGRAEYNRDNKYFMGSIDEIRVYNRALFEFEIQDIYNENESEICEDRYDEGYDNGYETGKQYCIDNPEACGISVNGGCSQADLDTQYQNGYNAGCSACSNGSATPATLSPGLDMHIPVLQYETLLGTMNLWADFEFEGESNGDLIWKLSDFGQE